MSGSSNVCLVHRPNLFTSKSLLRTHGRSIHENQITTGFEAILLIFVFMAQLVKGLELALLELPPRVP